MRALPLRDAAGGDCPREREGTRRATDRLSTLVVLRGAQLSRCRGSQCAVRTLAGGDRASTARPRRTLVDGGRGAGARARLPVAAARASAGGRPDAGGGLRQDPLPALRSQPL